MSQVFQFNRLVENQSKNWDIRYWNFLSADMLDAMEIIFMIVVVGEFIMGILGNGFIGLVNFIDWVKKRKIYLADIILTSLATSRIGLLFMIFLNGFTMTLYPEVFDCENIMRIIDGVWTIINHLNVWFATCLSVFYCLKIANFSHPLFLWLKWRLNRVIPIILLASLPISVFFSFLIIENYNEIFQDFILRKYKRNNTSSSVYSKMLLNLGSLFPFTVSLISFFLLILSLWKHVQKRKLNSLDATDPSTEIHLRALKTMISFLILFVIYCLTFFIATSNDFFPESELVMIFVQIIAPIYPLGHTFILIWGNIKLRQISLNALQQLKHCLKGDISIEQTMQK